MKPSVSVIIPAYNAEKTIENCLNAVLKQKYPRNKYEVIVVNDGSTDRTKEIVSKFPVRLINQKNAGPAKARNRGVRNAKANIVVFIDSDCVPGSTCLKNLVASLSDLEIVGVSGTYRTKNKDSFMARFTGYEIEQRHNKMKEKSMIDFIGTFNCAYRRNIFLQFGGFNTKFRTSSGEDPDLSYRISKRGYKLVFQPSAYVYHFHPNSLKKYLRQKFWRAYWKVFLYSIHKEKIFGDVYTPRTLFFQILFTGIFIFSLPLTSWSQFFIILSLFSLFLIFLFNLSLIKFIWSKEKLMAILTLPIVFLRNLVSLIAILYGVLSFKIRSSRNIF